MAEFVDVNGKRLIDSGPSPYGWHGIEALNMCPQLWSYRHLCGLEFAPKTALLKGTLVHVGMAHLYARRIESEAGRDPEIWLPPDDAILAKAQREGCTGGEDPVKIARELVREYSMKTAPLDAFKALDVERLFEIKIQDTYDYTARVDIVVEWRDKIWFNDWKTTYAIDGKTGTIYEMSGQFAGQRLIGRKLFGDKFGGIMITFLQTGSKFRCERTTLPATPNADADFEAMVAYAHRRREALKQQFPDPWHWPKTMSEHSCFTRYGKCRGWDHCSVGR